MRLKFGLKEVCNIANKSLGVEFLFFTALFVLNLIFRKTENVYENLSIGVYLSQISAL